MTEYLSDNFQRANAWLKSTQLLGCKNSIRKWGQSSLKQCWDFHFFLFNLTLWSSLLSSVLTDYRVVNGRMMVFCNNLTSQWTNQHEKIERSRSRSRLLTVCFDFPPYHPRVTHYWSSNFFCVSHSGYFTCTGIEHLTATTVTSSHVVQFIITFPQPLLVFCSSILPFNVTLHFSDGILTFMCDDPVLEDVVFVRIFKRLFKKIYIFFLITEVWCSLKTFVHLHCNKGDSWQSKYISNRGASYKCSNKFKVQCE